MNKKIKFSALPLDKSNFIKFIKFDFVSLLAILKYNHSVWFYEIWISPYKDCDLFWFSEETGELYIWLAELGFYNIKDGYKWPYFIGR